jgi:hypothetical protein
MVEQHGLPEVPDDGLRLEAIAADIAVTATPLWSC